VDDNAIYEQAYQDAWTHCPADHLLCAACLRVTAVCEQGKCAVQ
jgi:hypothetical protein